MQGFFVSMFVIVLIIIANMNYFYRRVWVDPVVDKGYLYQDDTSAPPVSILQRHILQKMLWTSIEHNGGTHHVKRKQNVDTSRCYYLQTHLQSIQMWDDDHQIVFSFLQEMMGNNIHSIQVWRDDTQSSSINQCLFVSTGNEALQQIFPLCVSGYINCSTIVYSDLYIEKGRELKG